jgi:Flp pilus assembly protein TadB
MLTAALLAVAMVAGAHPLLLTAAAAAVLHPAIPLAAAAAWAVYNGFARRAAQPTPSDEARFLRGIAAEVRSGASLRVAVQEAAGRAPGIDLRRAVRLAAAGADAAAIGGAVAAALPINGRLAGAAFRLSSHSGSSAAALFDALAGRAAEAAELAGERRAATAQARLSAGVVGLAPAAFTVLLIALGKGPALSGVGLAIFIMGFGLELVGLVVIGIILWRAER